MSVFEDIKTGLRQAIEAEKGNLQVRRTRVSMEPVPTFTPAEIKSIRKETHMSQAMFAQYMGVSVKTVEAWEAGRNHPNGSACRLLALTRSDPALPTVSGFVRVSGG